MNRKYVHSLQMESRYTGPRRLLGLLVAFLLIVVGSVVALTAPAAASSVWDEEMWTDDGGERGGSVVFDRNGDDLRVCDEDRGDDHYVMVKVGKSREGRYKTYAPDGNSSDGSKDCHYIHGAEMGGKWNLPEPGPWHFKICLKRTEDRTVWKGSCDTAWWGT